MEFQNLHIEPFGQYVKVTIDREKAMNALNRRTMEELHHYFSEIAPQQKAVRGIVLTGAGEKAFVAGADIKEFTNIDADSGYRMSQKGQEVFFLIERFPKPVVAVINGFALGGGCELAMSCHLRIAEEHARFGQPEVNLGLIPGYGGTQRLIQYVGKTKAMELLLTGDMFDAQQALNWGLVNQITPKGEGLEAAAKLLDKIGSKGPVAVAKVIECVNAYFEHGMDGFLKEVQDFGHTTGTEDFREGAQAFIEKRKANFQGK